MNYQNTYPSVFFIPPAKKPSKVDMLTLRNAELKARVDALTKQRDDLRNEAALRSANALLERQIDVLHADIKALSMADTAKK